MADTTTDQLDFNDSCIKIADDTSGYYHPVATNHFTVTIKFPKNLGVDNKNIPLNKTIDKDAELTLKIANDSFQSPGFTQQVLTYRKGNLAIDFPGALNAFTSTAKFHVFVSKSAYDLLYTWKLASGNHLTGEIGDPENYWATIMVDVTTGNKNTLVGTWTLNNCWCSDLQSITFDNNSNTLMDCSITIHYFKPKWDSSSTSAATAISSPESTT